MSKKSLISLENLDPGLLPEIQGFKEKQLAIVKENPFVEIENYATYEEAKKNRTALRTARTTLQNQEKVITRKLNDFKSKVKEETNKLIEITLPHEEKQQAEVSRWEEIKEQERLEKERLEQERIAGHKKAISDFKDEWSRRIDILVYENVSDFSKEFSGALKELDYETFEEFDVEMQTVVALLSDKLDDKLAILNQQEEHRQESLRLQKERDEQERIQKIKDGIENYFYHWSNEIGFLTSFSDLNKFYETLKGASLDNLDGFEKEFEEKREKLISLFESKVKILEQEQKQEQERLELQKEREQIATEKRENLYIKRVNALDKIDYFTFYEQGQNFKEEILEMPDDAFEAFVKESHESIIKSMDVESEVVGNEIEDVEFEETEDKDFVFPDDLPETPTEEKYSQAKHLIEYLNREVFAKDFILETDCSSEELDLIYDDFLKKFESLKQRTIKQIQKYEQAHN